MSKGTERFEAYLKKHRDEAQGDQPCGLELIESATAGPADKSEKFTLEEAFDYFHISDDDKDPSVSSRNLERAVRSVTFLLEWLSEHGNESVEGFTAHGLARILDRCADRLN
jgi:hypothetical protein